MTNETTESRVEKKGGLPVRYCERDGPMFAWQTTLKCTIFNKFECRVRFFKNGHIYIVFTFEKYIF